MADDERDGAGPAVVGRSLKYLAGACAVTGALIAATGALRAGALVFASAVVFFGTGGLLEGVEDRAVVLVILSVGVLSVIGVLGHLLTGL